MFYFIYGEDTYRSRRTLNEVCKELSQQREVFSFDASGESLREPLGIYLKGSLLFGSPAAVVVKYPLTGTEENKKFFAEEVKRFKHADTLFIFWDMVSGEVPSGKSNGKKNLKKTARQHNACEDIALHASKKFVFSYLANSSLAEAVNEIAASHQVKLASHDVAGLIQNFGGDLWAISHEIEKYALTGACEYQTRIKAEEKLYNFIDAIIEGNTYEAVKLLQGVRSAKFDDVYILSSLAGTLRNMLKIKSLVPQSPDYRKYEQFGMHPFVLKKTLSHVRRFRLEDLKRLYKKIIEADSLTKTGGDEEGVLVTRLIAEFGA